MAIVTWMKSDLRTLVFKILRQENSAANELLASTDVDGALEVAERQFARDTSALRRSATVAAVDEQASYAWPADICEVNEVWYDSIRLYPTTEQKVRQSYPDFRGDDAATPTHWWLEKTGSIRLWPPPDVDDETMEIEGYYIPFSIGSAIAALSRTSNVVTCTTSTAHGLRVGETVTISGCGTASFNDNYTVASVTSTTAFTAAQTAGNATVSSSYGYLSYTGGSLPMLADTDVCALKLEYRPALAYYAAWWCADNILLGDPYAQAAGDRALVKYLDAVSRACCETFII